MRRPLSCERERREEVANYLSSQSNTGVGLTTPLQTPTRLLLLPNAQYQQAWGGGRVAGGGGEW